MDAADTLPIEPALSPTPTDLVDRRLGAPNGTRSVSESHNADVPADDMGGSEDVRTSQGEISNADDEALQFALAGMKGEKDTKDLANLGTNMGTGKDTDSVVIGKTMELAEPGANMGAGNNTDMDSEIGKATHETGADMDAGTNKDIMMSEPKDLDNDVFHGDVGSAMIGETKELADAGIIIGSDKDLDMVGLSETKDLADVGNMNAGRNKDVDMGGLSETKHLANETKDSDANMGAVFNGDAGSETDNGANMDNYGGKREMDSKDASSATKGLADAIKDAGMTIYQAKDSANAENTMIVETKDATKDLADPAGDSSNVNSMMIGKTQGLTDTGANVGAGSNDVDMICETKGSDDTGANMGAGSNQDVGRSETKANAADSSNKDLSDAKRLEGANKDLSCNKDVGSNMTKNVTEQVFQEQPADTSITAAKGKGEDASQALKGKRAGKKKVAADHKEPKESNNASPEDQ
ncbi:unnamed protein product, partial [Effrenium voratum]